MRQRVRGSVEDRNTEVFDRRWSSSRKVTQVRPHVWRELGGELAGKQILEIGPGLRPTIQIAGSHFADISRHAVSVLREIGGHAHHFAGGRLPLDDSKVAAVFAFEVLEHVEQDEELLAEIARVLEPGGAFVFSVPLHRSMWTGLDETSAHVRRYEPDELFDKLERHGFTVEKYELRKGQPSGPMVKLATTALGVAPRFVNWVLQSLIFPLHAEYERHFAKTRWSRPVRPLPPSASGIRAFARLTA